MSEIAVEVVPLTDGRFGMPAFCCYIPPTSLAQWGDESTELKQTILTPDQRMGGAAMRAVIWTLRDIASDRAKREVDCAGSTHGYHDRRVTFF